MKKGLKVIVCGGRAYDDVKRVHSELDELHIYEKIRMIAEGGCRTDKYGKPSKMPEMDALGADYFAWLWAREVEIPCLTVWARWKAEGRAAGMKRNILMYDMVRPDVVIAFPGGVGTDHMVSHAKSMGCRIIDRRVAEEPPPF
jgi:hypothetical protein